MKNKNNNNQENIADLLWQKSLVFKKYSIWLSIAAIASILIGIIMLFTGLFIKFSINPSGVPLQKDWGNTTGTIYGPFPSYYPEVAKTLQIVAIIGSAFFYIAFIIGVVFTWTWFKYFKKRRHALKIDLSLGKNKLQKTSQQKKSFPTADLKTTKLKSASTSRVKNKINAFMNKTVRTKTPAAKTKTSTNNKETSTAVKKTTKHPSPSKETSSSAPSVEDNKTDTKNS